MSEAVEFTPLPPLEAIAYFTSKGYAPPRQRFSWYDVWRDEHARMFTVAKAMQDDILALFRDELTAALQEGRTMDEFIERLTPALQQAGWWGRQAEVDPLTGTLQDVQLGNRRRLRVIFDTNMRTSYAAGRWARIQRTKAAFPFLQYRQVDRPTKREEHARYHGIILPVDHPAWEKIFPPNGWFCGCSVRQLTRSQMAREGLSVTEDFELESETFMNPRSGETSDLPLGVHPGFDTNPGALWLAERGSTRP
jgi:SPP1 gp7 family putative phage head morphogenesis protein